MKEGQELVEAPTTAIRRFSEFDQQLADFKEMNSKMVFDIETYEGETDCKKYLAKIGDLRIGVEKLRKSLKKKSLEEGRSIDTDAKAYQADIAEIDAVHSVPLKELETKRINEALAIQEEARVEAKRIQDEKDAELVKLRAIVADQEVALKAAEEAVIIEAEVKEQEQQYCEGAEANAEQAVVVQETVRITAPIRKPIANQDHRREFNNLAAEKLTLITKDLDMSIAIVTAIVKNEIDNVKMLY